MKETMKETIASRRKMIYKSPLPKKKQRTSLKGQRNGKVKIFTEEEKFLYLIRKLGEELKRNELQR